ncbi:MAG TPA: efflux RND transporter periplasmic adaptor subunit [Verrucomicrobiae bacterium]
MHTPSKFIAFLRRQPRWRLALAVVIVIAGAWFVWQRGATGDGNSPTFTARRGPLEITVLEGGSLQALESQEIKCEVRVGYQGTKILKIVEEGYLVTEEDVRTNKVLVELDSSELEKQIAQQEIQYQSALANLTESQQNYEIQLNQNQSDIKAAEQKLRFARMDFDKFLGAAATDEIVKELGLEKLIAEASTNNVEAPNLASPAGEGQGNGRSNKPPTASVAPDSQPQLTPEQARELAAAMVAASRATASSGDATRQTRTVVRSGSPTGKADAGPVLVAPSTEPVTSATEPREASFQLPSPSAIDFMKYADPNVLGDGEAKQKLRKFDDDLQVAQKEQGQSTATLEGTRRLFDKGFVTKNDLQRDEIAHDNSRLKVQTAETARTLFLKYDFAKSAEESLSKYLDAVRELDKTRRLAISKLAQANARLRSAQGQYQVQLRQRNDLAEQQAKCVIHAQKSGLVVYGGGRDEEFYYGGEERIREGATVRERQAIITIPDMTRMSVKVKIHETYIKKVQKGQKARITVDAFPDKVLTGEVTKVGVLPDSQNRWMNPDLKVYAVTIAIDGTQDWVKPGMSAKVEILVNKLADVVHVPVQAVSLNEGKQVCYVSGGLKPERREVEIGEFTDEFIEIKKGLKEGEKVLLRPPDGTEQDNGREVKPAEEKQPAAPSSKPTPASTPAAAPKAVKTAVYRGQYDHGETLIS